MTVDEMVKLFKEAEHDYAYRIYGTSKDQFNKFYCINKKSKRKDLHAFNLIDEIVPGEIDIVSCAEHDQIWLEVELSDLAEVITKEQIVELVHCGIRYEDNALVMHV